MTTLLIIEDDPLVLRMYQQAFTFNNHKVVVADNGKTGVDKAQTEKPDAILLDIMMPTMNGLEVLKKLKADGNTKNIPVVILTNLGKDEDVEAALKLGAVKYITKVDFTPKEVVKQVEEIIGDEPEAANIP